MISIDVSNEQSALAVDAARLRRAVAAVLHDAGVAAGSLSIAIVDDAEIHALNRRYLQHDYPTDVLSFLLERDGELLEGEVIASAETAARAAAALGWPSEDELLLYVVHGVLHLVGYDDADEALGAEMRAAEGRYLARFGLRPPAGPLASEEGPPR